MVKSVRGEVWAFDLEWVPDPEAGRALYKLEADIPDEAVRARMYQEGGATEENPRPYLKTVVCRIVSASVVIRRTNPGNRELIELRSLPELEGSGDRSGAGSDERTLIERFLKGVGKNQPQLVGFNSKGADILILLQRALLHGISVPEFFPRGGQYEKTADYLHRYDDWHVDLMDAVGGFRRGAPSLNELAVLSKIPGKLDVTGLDVVTLWEAGKLDEIVQYNECDAVTTYLVWLRYLHLTGKLSSEAYLTEQLLVRELLERTRKPHLDRYLAEWHRLGGLPESASSKGAA